MRACVRDITMFSSMVYNNVRNKIYAILAFTFDGPNFHRGLTRNIFFLIIIYINTRGLTPDHDFGPFFHFGLLWRS